MKHIKGAFISFCLAISITLQAMSLKDFSDFLKNKLQLQFISAISNGNMKLAKLCWFLGAEINKKGENGCLPIHFATDNYDIFSWLVELGGKWRTADDFRRTTLFFASGIGCLPVMKFCIENNADINARTINLTTPLMHAARCNKRAAVELLLRNGADSNAVDTQGKSALHLACCNSEFSLDLGRVIVTLVEHTASRPIIEEENGKIKIVGFTKNLECKDAKGITPLMCASMNNGELVSTLLEFGANWRARDNDGMTPFLHAAASKNKRAMLEFLLNAPEYVLFAQKDNNNCSALAIARNGWDFGIIRLTNKDIRKSKMAKLARKKIAKCAEPRIGLLENVQKKNEQGEKIPTPPHAKNIVYTLRNRELGATSLHPLKLLRPPEG